MKIAILSTANVSSWYAATLMERGHEITVGPFGYASTALASMMEDGIEGVLILTDDDSESPRFSQERPAAPCGAILLKSRAEIQSARAMFVWPRLSNSQRIT
jgi:hypothetical protein